MVQCATARSIALAKTFQISGVTRVFDWAELPNIGDGIVKVIAAPSAARRPCPPRGPPREVSASQVHTGLPWPHWACDYLAEACALPALQSNGSHLKWEGAPSPAQSLGAAAQPGAAPLAGGLVQARPEALRTARNDP